MYDYISVSWIGVNIVLFIKKKLAECKMLCMLQNSVFESASESCKEEET